jgi:hypothetical protein
MHSIAAAIYAATAVRDGVKHADAGKAAEKERKWQEKHLKLYSKYKEGT